MSLLSYQETHVEQLETALKHASGTAIDASDTGTGKTYAAAGLAKRLGLRVAVFCPKAVIISWHRVLESFGVEILGIANYELIKGGKWYTDGTFTTKESCPYMCDRLHNESYTWKDIEDDMLFIFDEVHRCKNPSTVNAKLLMSLCDEPCKKLLLSATIADKPQFFAVFAKMLGFIDEPGEFRLFLKKLRTGTANTTGQYLQKIKTDAPAMLKLHRKLYPHHASRMRINDLKDVFPDNRVMPETYMMDPDTVEEIKKQYEYISAVHTEAQALEDTAQYRLVQILRARQKIEALKVKTITELAKDHVANGASVAIFVNYLDTMALLQDMLGTDCIIKGGQTTEERQSMIDSFNADKERIIICQIQSGGVGISLHDTHGDYPRVSIISPSWSAQDLMQALGRIHRANGKTPCIQKLVYCHGTIEELICKIVQSKIKNYLQLNDG